MVADFQRLAVMGIIFVIGDYRGVTVLSIIENQILKPINHVKYISKKKLLHY